MYRELSGNKYWGVDVREFAGGDFSCLFLTFLSVNLITHP